MLSWFRAGHDLPYAKPTRVPPDPTLFPNYLQNAQGLWLRYAEWWPRANDGSAGVTTAVRGVVFIVSGLAEHSGRYDSVALRLTGAGYVCFSVDNQGAGGSEGVRLYVERFSHFVDDIQLFVHHMQVKYPALTRLPRFLLGHSMGGLIATHVAMRDPEFFNGVVLSGPAHGSPMQDTCGLRQIVSCLSRVCPKLPGGGLDPCLTSRNQPVTELVLQDPFYARSSLRARFGNEMFLAQDYVFEHVETERTSFPFLIVHGGEDRLTSVAKSGEFYERATSTDKQRKVYPGAYHEVLTEVCRDEVMHDVLAFIEAHTSPKSMNEVKAVDSSATSK